MEKQTVINKIVEINSIIDNAADNINIELTGNLGIVIFKLYYAKYTKEKKEIQQATLFLEKAIVSFNTYQEIDYTFSSGIIGFMWLLQHFIKIGFLDFDITQFETYYPAINDSMRKALTIGNFDFLHGSSGIILYYLSIYDKREKNNIISEFLKKMEDCSIIHDFDCISWKYYNRIKKSYAINFSLSHGMASILIIISKIHQLNQNKTSAELIRRAINYYAKNKKKKGLNLYPDFTEINGNYNALFEKDTRLAWCYGDLGIGMAFWHASQVMNRKDLEDEAIAIFKHASKRRDLKSNGIIDAGLCHGTAGIAHIFNRMYRNTGIEEFKETSDFWIMETLKMNKFKDGLAGYKAWKGDWGWRNEYGLLDGIAGIGLALIAAISNDDPAWDECLLLS